VPSFNFVAIPYFELCIDCNDMSFFAMLDFLFCCHSNGQALRFIEERDRKFVGIDETLRFIFQVSTTPLPCHKRRQSRSTTVEEVSLCVGLLPKCTRLHDAKTNTNTSFWLDSTI
jgi:phosphatidylglycerophosphatase A